SEETRLKYRYIDLRRPSLQRYMERRHVITEAIRETLGSMGFLDIQTPVLVRSTPEGARDFVVPSRRYPGRFYALPQSPQLYKQLLMISGFDRYYQIAPCFRDEDQRADRQLMFSQVDLEMSFCDEEDVYAVIEKVVSDAFMAGLGVKLELPFERITYKEAMDRFGSDKPDLRFGMEMCDVTDIAARSDFEVFKSAASSGGRVRALAAPGCSGMTRKEVDELTELAKAYRAKGLVALKCAEGALTGSAAKFLPAGVQAELVAATGAKDGDMVFMTADKPAVSAVSLGQVRKALGKRLGLIPKDVYKLCWVTDFPMFEWNEDENKWDAMHHIFTSPKEEHLEFMEKDPGKVLGRLYDLVLNGNELGSGSIRISDPQLQRRVMNVIGMPYEQAEAKFGFLLKAYNYGAPIHGGIALGLDRLLAIMLDLDNLKDVIAFPQNSGGISLVDDCPNFIDEKQWQELHIMPDAEALRNMNG
ncbi:MAG TPA: aspartate--tRNA ligase, partial [Bacillota bacterium]|nr:aspartate--tRNA ligase [Bacillota bacterium]